MERDEKIIQEILDDIEEIMDSIFEIHKIEDFLDQDDNYLVYGALLKIREFMRSITSLFAVSYVTEENYPQYSPILLFSSESSDLFDISIILASYGYYDAANTLLRNSIESISKAFFYYYTYKNLHLDGLYYLRKDKFKKCQEKMKKFIYNLRKIEKEKNVVTNMIELLSLTIEYEFRKYILNIKYQYRFSFDCMVQYLLEWGFLEPFKSKQKLKDYVLYDKLSNFSHENFAGTDTYFSLILENAEPLGRKILPELIVDYYFTLSRVADYYCLLFLNFFRKKGTFDEKFKEEFFKIREIYNIDELDRTKYLIDKLSERMFEKMEDAA